MHSSNENLLIRSLSASACTRLAKDLTPITLPARFCLYHSSTPPVFAHFITTGLASMVSSTAEGGTTEVGLIGQEGVVGSWHVIGPAAVNIDCFMQVEGSAFRIPLTDLTAVIRDMPEIRARILEFAQFQFLNLAQLTLCQRRHDAKQRLARWLLMSIDRTGTDTIGLTQEFLAIMLGVARPTITLLLADLEREGSLSCRRGSIAILNRPLLASTACECYEIARSSLYHLYRESVST